MAQVEVDAAFAPREGGGYPRPSSTHRDDMSQQTVLVVDDERDIRELLTITLGRMDLLVDAVGTVTEARRALAIRLIESLVLAPDPEPLEQSE